MALGEVCCRFLSKEPPSSVLIPTHSKNPALPRVRFLGLSGSTSRRSCGVRCSAVDDKAASGDVFSVTSSSKSDVDYLGESTKGDLNVKKEHLDAFGEFQLPHVM